MDKIKSTGPENASNFKAKYPKYSTPGSALSARTYCNPQYSKMLRPLKPGNQIIRPRYFSNWLDLARGGWVHVLLCLSTSLANSCNVGWRRWDL